MSSLFSGAYFQMHLAIFIWGFTGVLGKLIQLNETPLVWYRIMIASLFMWLFFYKTKVQKVAKKDLFNLSLQGVILALHWLAFYGAIKYANVSITLCCMASSAFFASLLEPIYFRRKLNGIEILLGTVVIFGIFQIFYSPVNQELINEYSLGIILGIIAAFLSAWVTVLSKKYSSQYNGYTLTFYQIFTGFIIFSFFVPFHMYENGIQAWLPTFTDWIYLLIMGIVCTVIACSLALNSLQHLSSYTVTLNINLEPVYGIILAFLIFKENEHFNYRFYIGAAIIITALMLHALYISQQKIQKIDQEKRAI